MSDKDNAFMLDGADTSEIAKEFEYALPRPFGPKKGPAILKITARPATGANSKYKAAVDRITSNAKLKDMTNKKAYEQNGNEAAFIKENEAAIKSVIQNTFGALYDHCIISWETTIQKGGEDLPATRENFMGLVNFAHPDIVAVIDQIRTDLGEHAKFHSQEEIALHEEEAKN